MKTQQQITKRVKRATDIMGDILQRIDINSKIKLGISGGMSIGKTFLINELAKNYSKQNIYNIMVAPVTTLCNQVAETEYYSFTRLISGDKYEGDISVVTTPDSLPKIIEKIGDSKFILYIDEAHKKVDEAFFRDKAYKNIIKYGKLENCIAQLDFSATIENLIELEKYDVFYNLEGKNRPIKEFNLYVVDKLNQATKLSILNKFIKNENHIFYFNNNVEQNKKIDEIMNLKTRKSKLNLLNEDVKVKHSHLSSANKDLSDISIDLVKRKTINSDIKYFGFTSAGEVGVEAYLDKPTDFIVFGNRKTFTFNGEIQATGRVRSEVDTVNLVVEKSENQIEFISDWKQFREYEINAAYKEYENYKRAFDMIKGTNVENHLKMLISQASYNDKFGYYSSYEVEDDKIIINDYKLEYLMWQKYWGLILTRPDILLDKFKNHKSITVASTEIIDKDKLSPTYKQVIDVKENINLIYLNNKDITDQLSDKDVELIAIQDLSKDNKKEEIKKATIDAQKYLTSKFNDKDLLKLFNKELDHEQYEEYYLKLNLIKDRYKTKYKVVKKLLSRDKILFKNEEELNEELEKETLVSNFIKNSYSLGELKDIETRVNIKEYSKLYKQGKLDMYFVRDKAQAKQYYLIRKYFEDENGKLKRDRLSNKKINNLYDYLKESGNINRKKEYTEVEHEKLQYILNIIYYAPTGTIRSVSE